MPWRAVKYSAAGLAVGLVLVGQVLFVVSLRQATQGGSQQTTVSSQQSARSATTDQVAGPVGHVPRLVDRVLTSALGASDRGVRRFQIVAWKVDRRQRHRMDITVRWAINNDLSFGSLGNGAETDAFLMLRALYTSSLPIANARLVGTYPASSRDGREQTVMILTMDAARARTVTTAGWDDLGPDVVWPMMRRVYVAPAFQPIQGE